MNPQIRAAVPAAESAYIHFAAVAPHARHRGYARLLYENFFGLVRAAGRTPIRAITAPDNADSATFHQVMGFTVSGLVAGYNGPGHDMLVVERTL